MPTYTCRAQTVLTEEQYSLLRSLSEERGKAVNVLVPEAIEQVYVQGATGSNIYNIGKIVTNEGVFLCHNSHKAEISYQGYDHFAE